MPGTLSQQARARIRLEMDRLGLNQTDVAGLLNWSQSKVSKVLNGHVSLTVADLGALCFAVGMSPVEAVRDMGYEFCAEMTPTELRMVQYLRALSPAQRDGVLVLLQIAKPDSRRATPEKQRGPRKINPQPPPLPPKKE